MDIAKITSPYRIKIVISAYGYWLKKDEKVLDLGCGNGIVSSALKEYYLIDILGCDLKNYLTEDIPFLQIKSGEHLPFANKSFDAILLNDVLHHLPYQKQQSIIRESLRVAKKVLIFEAEPTFLAKITDIILNKFHYDSLSTPLSFRSKRDWELLFKNLSITYKSRTLKRPFFYPFSHLAFYLHKK